jgi:hypothetical protein
MPIRVSCFLAALLAGSPAATACTVQWRDPLELQAQAEVVVLGTVLSRSASPPTFRGVDYTYRVEIERVERGAFPSRVMDLGFEALRMHRRGDTVVCPLQNGSGIEHALEPGRRYRFFLGSTAPPTLSIAIAAE